MNPGDECSGFVAARALDANDMEALAYIHALVRLEHEHGSPGAAAELSVAHLN